MLDVCAASLLESCGTLEDNDLNTSDHLPQSVQLEFPCKPNDAPISGTTRIDWSNVVSSSALNTYQSEISALVTPFLGRCHESIDCLNEELELIANNIKTLAEMTLPTIQPSKKRKKSHFFKDSTLKHLCERSKSAWREWCDAGRPQSGPLYETKKDLRREIKKRINLCAAIDERKPTTRRERMFRQKESRRFKAPHRQIARCSKLRVNGEVLSARDDLVGAWANHFSNLSKSLLPSEEGLQQLDKKMDDLTTGSLSNEEYILDVPFTLDEVVCAVKKLKPGKPLKWGGESLHLWLLGIVNSIVDMEDIPPSFKLGSIYPVYKGGCKDPLLTANYRGITMNSMFSKILQILTLSRLEPTLTEAGFPHLNKSAFRKHTGCTDAIFATQELIARYISEGSTVHMCLLTFRKPSTVLNSQCCLTGYSPLA